MEDKQELECDRSNGAISNDFWTTLSELAIFLVHEDNGRPNLPAPNSAGALD